MARCSTSKYSYVAEGFPKFKSKHKGTHRVGFPQNTKVDFENSKVSVNKIGWLKTKISRNLFQFQNSAIESLSVDRNIEALYEFQFQNSAIERSSQNECLAHRFKFQFQNSAIESYKFTAFSAIFI